MGSKLSCLSDGTVRHVDAHTLQSYESATRATDAKQPSTSTSTKRLASSSSLDTHKQSVFSHHATTLQHSARSSLSLAHPFEHLRLQSVDDKEKVDVDMDEQLKTALSSSATSSLAGSPRHVHAMLSSLEQQSALSRGTTASSLVTSLSPSPSPASRTLLAAEQHDRHAKAVIEEYKEQQQQPAIADSRPPVHHQRGFSDSSAAIRPVSDAATLTNPPKDAEMMSRRSPYTDAQVKRVVTNVQPSPHHSRRPTLIQPTLAPSASSSSLSSAVSPSASPVSSVVGSYGLTSSASAHTLPPSVHLTSINLRIAAAGNQSAVPEPCPSPLDLTRSFSSSSSSSATAASSSTAAVTVGPPPPPKADIHHQLDEVLVYRAITAYHREHRDEGLGPSWWTAHSLQVAGSERERERVRRSERIISISGGAGVFVSSSQSAAAGVSWDGDRVSGEWLSEEEAMKGWRLMQNPSTIGSFLRSINA